MADTFTAWIKPNKLIVVAYIYSSFVNLSKFFEYFHSILPTLVIRLSLVSNRRFELLVNQYIYADLLVTVLIHIHTTP